MKNDKCPSDQASVLEIAVQQGLGAGECLEPVEPLRASEWLSNLKRLFVSEKLRNNDNKKKINDVKNINRMEVYF